MLNVTLAQKIDPFCEAQKWIAFPGISMQIGSSSVQIEGNLKEEHISDITRWDIKRLTNVKPPQNQKACNNVIEENGRSTKIRANFKDDDTHEFRRIRKGQVWEVDFGQPVGREFGYPHPAIVLGKSSTNNCMVVLPCSSKEKIGRIYTFNVTEETLKSADPKFMESSADKSTYVLFDQQTPVDRVRFTKYLGTLDENLFQNILKALGRKEEEIKRKIVLENLSLTEKQNKILAITNRNSDLSAVANNEFFTYEQRVRGILSVFGFTAQSNPDVEYLFNFVRNVKNKNSSYIDLRVEMDILSRGTLLKSSTINCKLVELVKTRFGVDVHPCLLEFVSLVNKLAV